MNLKNIVCIILLGALFQVNANAKELNPPVSERFKIIGEELLAIEEARLIQKTNLSRESDKLKELRVRLDEIEESLREIEQLRDEMNSNNFGS